jgi:hypothetical protein
MQTTHPTAHLSGGRPQGLSQPIRKQIKEWIRTDARCVRLQAEIAALKERRSQLWGQFRTRQQSDHWQMYHELKRIDDFRVSIVERRKRVHQIAKRHTGVLARQSSELRRELGRLDTRLARAVNSLGHRRGFLRKDLADRFVKLAAREAARRCKL